VVKVLEILIVLRLCIDPHIQTNCFIHTPTVLTQRRHLLQLQQRNYDMELLGDPSRPFSAAIFNRSLANEWNYFDLCQKSFKRKNYCMEVPISSSSLWPAHVSILFTDMRNRLLLVMKSLFGVPRIREGIMPFDSDPPCLAVCPPNR